jgi:hypothetical protein
MDKTEIKKLIKSEVESMFQDMLKKHLAKPENKKLMKDSNKETLINFVRTLWTQRSFWDSKL